MGAATPTDAERIAQLEEKVAAAARVLDLLGASYSRNWLDFDFNGDDIEVELWSLRQALEATEPLEPEVWLRSRSICPSCQGRYGRHEWRCDEAEATA